VFGLLTVKPKANVEAQRKLSFAAQQKQAEQLAKLPNIGRDAQAQVPGQAEFASAGCGGCHVKGKEQGGPDLVDVTKRREGKWLKEWIMTPEKYYDDASIVPLIKRYGVKMPNQNVAAADADKIIAYLTAWESKSAPSVTGSTGGVGAQIFDKTCFACHANGIGGAPKVGDKSAWSARLVQDKAILYKHALEGFQGKSGFMPPKGGCMDCTEEQIKAAVEFLRSKANAE